MGSYRSAVHEVDLPSHFPTAVFLFLQLLEHLLPDASLLPAIEAAVDRLPGTVALRQVSPGRPGTQYPKDAVEDGAVVLGRATARRFLCRQEGGDLGPLLFGKLLSASHPNSLEHFANRP